jgi:predicted Zn-dependent protease
MDFLNDLFGKIKKKKNRLKSQRELKRLCKIIVNKPENLQLAIRLGDLLIKLGKKDEAIEVYTQAAEKFAQKDFLRQATAINKVIIRLDPKQNQSSRALGRLSRRGLNMEDGYCPEKDQPDSFLSKSSEAVLFASLEKPVG